MNKESMVTAIALLSRAYTYAKAGDAESAGMFFVHAAEDDALDEVMDGIAQSAEALEEGDFEDLPDEVSDTEVIDEEGYEDDEEDEDDEDYGDEEDEEELTASATEVSVPESVARLAARTLI